MIQVSIPAALRSSFGKGASRQLRMKKITPAVVYSDGADAMALQLDSTMLYKSLVGIHGRNAVITLNIEGDDKGERHVLVREIQKNPVTDSLVHVDFYEIALEKPAVFAVPIKYVGTAKGAELGGELNITQTALKLKGAPLDIPDDVEIDISNLDRGESRTYGDMALPDKVEMLDSAATVCVSVS